MAKKKRASHKLPYENTQRRPPWNATKADAKRYQAQRDRKNEVHALQAELIQRDAVIENLAKARDQLRRMLDAVCDPRYLRQLSLVCEMSVKSSVELGLVEALTSLVQWSALFLQGGVAENVRQVLDATDFEVKTIPNAPPLMPRPSGITTLVADHDDPDSVDDLFAKAVDVHLERMDKRHYWIGITPVGGETIHIDITQKRNEPIRARVRK